MSLSPLFRAYAPNKFSFSQISKKVVLSQEQGKKKKDWAPQWGSTSLWLSFCWLAFKQQKNSISIFMGYYMPPQFKCDLASKVKLCSLQSLMCVETFSGKRPEKASSVVLKSQSNIKALSFQVWKTQFENAMMFSFFCGCQEFLPLKNETESPLFTGNLPSINQDLRCHEF